MSEAVAPSADVDGLGEFLRRAARTKLLSAPEEHELARRIERGDLRARDRMIEANLLLVVSVAKRHRHPGMPLADLIQEGTIGLIRAVEKFDHRRGNRSPRTPGSGSGSTTHARSPRSHGSYACRPRRIPA